MFTRHLFALSALLVSANASAQMGHSLDVTADTARAGASLSDVGDLHFIYDKLIDSTTIEGAFLSDAHSGSNFLMSAVTGHNVRPMVIVVPTYRIEGQKHQPSSPPDSIVLLVTAMLSAGTEHAASRMDAKAPTDGELILLLDDSVRTRVPLKLLDTDSYSTYVEGTGFGTGMTTYVAAVPYSFVVRWSAANKVEGRMPSGDFSFHGKDAHKWQAFTDYVSGKTPRSTASH